MNKYLVKLAERTLKEHATRYGKRAVRKLTGHIESTIMGATLGATGGYLKAKAEEEKKKLEERRRKRAELRKQAEDKPDGLGKRTAKYVGTLTGLTAVNLPLHHRANQRVIQAGKEFSPNVSKDTIRHMKTKANVKKVYHSTSPRFEKTKAYGNSFYQPAHGKNNYRTRVYATNRASAVHELGHAVSVGKSRLSKNLRGSALLASHAAPYASAALILSGDKEKAKYAPAIAAAGAVHRFSEEFAANKHAYKALKRMQGESVAKGFAKKYARPQLKGYVHGLGVAPLAAYGAYKWIYRNKDKENKHLNKAATMLLLVGEDKCL